MTEEIMNLSTIVERSVMTIKSKKHPKGKVYECANLADFGPFEYAQLAMKSGEVDKLKAVKKPTAAQKRLAEKMLNDVVKMICPSVAPAVLAELTGQQKQMIVINWSLHVQSERDGAAEGNAPKPRPRTTAGSSRVSKRSTAARRKRGSTPPRGA